MDRKPKETKCCSALPEVPEEAYSSGPDSSSLSDGQTSCVELDQATVKSPASSELPPPEPQSKVVTYPWNSPLIRAVALGQDRNAPWKKDMEDVSVLLQNYGAKKGTGFFGVFDGFYGRASAEMAANELSVLLLEQLVRVDPSFLLDGKQKDFLSRMATLLKRDDARLGPEGPVDVEVTSKEQQMTQAFARAFSNMDCVLGLGRGETSKFRWSACTSVVCVVDQETSSAPEKSGHKASQGTLHIANCGNIHAVLCKHGKSFRLTKDHSTANSAEHKRILREGGSISPNKHHGLVEGLLKATRALGNYGDQRLRRLVIPVPHQVSLSLEPSAELLVLGSSGLWGGGLEPEDVAPVVQRCVQDWRAQLGRQRAKREQRCRALRGSEAREDTGDNAEDMTVEGTKKQTSTGGEEDDHEPAVTNRLPTDEHVEEDRGRSNEDYKELAGNICKKLIKKAVAAGSRENISVIVILFQGIDEVDTRV